MSPTVSAQLQIHICVLLWGFTAILGKMITLPALSLVWWRMLAVTLALALFPRVWRGIRALSPRMLWIYAGIGVLVSLHWLTFYAAIKLANASIAATCIALAPVFLALVEPRIAQRRFDARELLLGVAVIPGVALVVGGVRADMRMGVAVGALSALLVAIFGAFNKRYVERADPLTVTAIELGAGTVFLSVIAPLLPGSTSPWTIPTVHDAVLLAVLALACTWLPFTLSLHALRRLSAFNVQLAVNLEPVYAIVFAIVLLDEQRELSSSFYIGVLVILLAVVAHPLLTRRRVSD